MLWKCKRLIKALTALLVAAGEIEKRTFATLMQGLNISTVKTNTGHTEATALLLKSYKKHIYTEA